MTECRAPKCGCEGDPQWHKDKTDRLLEHIHQESRTREFQVRLEAALREVKSELLRAYVAFPVDFRSAHEGVAIIEEEFLEFRKAAYWPHKTKSNEEEEATQLAAMVLRYLIDVCYKEDVPR